MRKVRSYMVANLSALGVSLGLSFYMVFWRVPFAVSSGDGFLSEGMLSGVFDNSGVEYLFYHFPIGSSVLCVGLLLIVVNGWCFGRIGKMNSFI